MAFNYTITHNGNIWNSSVGLDSIPLQNGSVTGSITTAGTRTLHTAGKYAPNNIIIGAKTLNCAGKIITGDIVITSEEPGFQVINTQNSWSAINYDIIEAYIEYKGVRYTLQDNIAGAKTFSVTPGDAINYYIKSSHQSGLGVMACGCQLYENGTFIKWLSSGEDGWYQDSFANYTDYYIAYGRYIPSTNCYFKFHREAASYDRVVIDKIT